MVENWDDKLATIRAELERIEGLDGAQGRGIDDLFVAWFVRAHAGCSWEQAFLSLTGHHSDKGLDAVLIDYQKRAVLIVQGKLRRSMSTSENRNDLLGFARLSAMLTLDADDERLAAFHAHLDPTAANLFAQARQGAASGFKFEFVYLTTGSVSPVLQNESTLEAQQAFEEALFSVFDGKITVGLFEDYRLDVVPRIQYITLEPAHLGEILLSQQNGVEARAVVVRGSDLAAIYKEFDLAVFARNIRGFLGATAINAGIKKTIQTDADAFFYLNNGVTIICNQISVSEQGGRRRLTLRYPQIINGQQTTRSLHSAGEDSENVHVLVRIVVVPQSALGQDPGASLVDKIVKATNWQNSISKADLRTNDHIQIELERCLRELGYQYLRRKENRNDAMRRVGYQLKNKIKKEELARAVATCLIDGFVNRIGTSKAFDPDEDYYDEIFGQPVNHQLNCYWFVRTVTSVGRKKSFMGEGKWLAAYDTWRLLPSELRESGRLHAQFSRSGSNDTKALLAQLFERSLQDMKRFYSHSVRGQSPKPAASKFFKRATHRDFQIWANNNPREPFSRALRAFVSSVPNS